MRAPFQVLVFPYRFRDGEPEILIGQRSDDGSWQAVSGGGELGETILEAATRELREEAALEGIDWVQLDSICTLPRIHFKDHENWVRHPYVVPEYSFMTLVNEEPKPSEEHVELKWCSVSEATELLKYDSNKIALWEVGQRLSRLKVQHSPDE